MCAQQFIWSACAEGSVGVLEENQDGLVVIFTGTPRLVQNDIELSRRQLAGLSASQKPPGLVFSQTF